MWKKIKHKEKAAILDKKFGGTKPLKYSIPCFWNEKRKNFVIQFPSGRKNKKYQRPPPIRNIFNKITNKTI